MTAVAPQTPDFYFWVFLKDHVYENRPQSIAELKVAITQKIHAIRKEECVRVIDNFAHQLEVCLKRNSSHLEHVLVIIMYIYHALINALCTHMIHINLNAIFCTLL